jgi:uncharacterized protein HemX
MLNLPVDPTCSIGDGDTVEILDDYWILPDGSTRETLEGCEISPPFTMVMQMSEGRPRKHKAKHKPVAEVIVAEPAPITADDVPADTTAVVAVLPPEPERMPPHSSVSPVTVALAVGVAGAAGWLGWQAMQSATAASAQAQQKQDEQRRKECATASDSVSTDFRARLATFNRAQVPQVVDPAALWQRCDALESTVDQVQLAARRIARRR